MPQATLRPYADFVSVELLAIAILSLLLILLLPALGRGWRGAWRIGLGLAALLLAACAGLLWVGRAAEPAATSLSRVAGDQGGDDPYAGDGKRFLHPRRLYGPDVADARLQEARSLYGDFLDRARMAELATFPGGESVLAARFDNTADVAEAARAYLQRFRVEMATGDLTQGLRGQRSDLSDRVEILLDGDMLVVWTARTVAALAARRRASQAGGGTKPPVGFQSDPAAGREGNK